MAVCRIQAGVCAKAEATWKQKSKKTVVLSLISLPLLGKHRNSFGLCCLLVSVKCMFQFKNAHSVKSILAFTGLNQYGIYVVVVL